MGRIDFSRINLRNIDLRSRYIYVPAIIIGIALLIGAAWWFSIERLPGYDTDTVLKSSFVEPGGNVSEYFTGTVVDLEISIIGPKMIVKMDATGSDRTFFLPSDTPVWIGLKFGDKTITGEEKVTYNEIKPGQRVAVFIGPANKARRINIIER